MQARVPSSLCCTVDSIRPHLQFQHAKIPEESPNPLRQMAKTFLPTLGMPSVRWKMLGAAQPPLCHRFGGKQGDSQAAFVVSDVGSQAKLYVF